MRGQTGAERPPWGASLVEIDLAALRHNLLTFQRCAPRSRLIAVVKANAYGHGAVEVSRVALGAGAWALAVARVREGVELRRAGVVAPILVLGYVPDSELSEAVDNDLSLTVGGWKEIEAVESLAAAGRRVRVHVKLDTGMHRFGFEPGDAVEAVRTLRNIPTVEVEGLYTHYATADQPDSPILAAQKREFRGLLGRVEAASLRPPVVHGAASAGAIVGPDEWDDAVRIGIGLYGVEPVPGMRAGLRPVMSVRARVGRVLDVHEGEGVSYGHAYVAERSHRAAVVTFGYADGYLRALSNRGEVLIGGRRCRVLGRVCMDSVIVELGEDVEASVGDEAVILGQQGAEQLRAEEVAELGGTIAYELLCGLGRRSDCRYVDIT